MSRTRITDDGVFLVLDNGNVITSKGDAYTAGSNVGGYNDAGEELGYWDCAEWEDDPELVMGAILLLAAGAEVE